MEWNEFLNMSNVDLQVSLTRMFYTLTPVSSLYNIFITTNDSTKYKYFPQTFIIPPLKHFSLFFLIYINKEN